MNGYGKSHYSYCGINCNFTSPEHKHYEVQSLLYSDECRRLSVETLQCVGKEISILHEK